jgi:hypothetical protein
MNAQHSSDLVYHGYSQEPFGRVIVLESPDGTQTGTLAHVVRHSPSGFNWGYRGSGPCDTALSLLIDAMGDAAICPACRGTGRVVYATEHGLPRAEPFDAARHPWSGQGWPCQCSGGFRQVPYAEFVEQFVAHWGDEWVMSRSSVLAWLAPRTDAPGGAPRQ